MTRFFVKKSRTSRIRYPPYFSQHRRPRCIVFFRTPHFSFCCMYTLSRLLFLETTLYAPSKWRRPLLKHLHLTSDILDIWHFERHKNVYYHPLHRCNVNNVNLENRAFCIITIYPTTRPQSSTTCVVDVPRFRRHCLSRSVRGTLVWRRETRWPVVKNSAVIGWLHATTYERAGKHEDMERKNRPPIRIIMCRKILRSPKMCVRILFTSAEGRMRKPRITHVSPTIIWVSTIAKHLLFIAQSKWDFISKKNKNKPKLNWRKHLYYTVINVTRNVPCPAHFPRHQSKARVLQR